MRIFVDMDGTIVRFYEADDCLEKMYEIGFFENLRPHAKMIKMLEKLNEKGYEIFILSACISMQCEIEKQAWLDKYLPWIDKAHRIFTRCGMNKAEYIKRKGYDDARVNVLIDDYSRNLDEWNEAFGKHGIAIKAINEINNKKKKNTYKKYIKII